MRQALAKGTRRELRRAVGVSALDAIQDMEQAIAILQTWLSSAHREIASLEVNHAEFKKATYSEFDVISRASMRDSLRIDHSFDLFNRPFLGRLRWLFTGQ